MLLNSTAPLVSVGLAPPSDRGSTFKGSSVKRKILAAACSPSPASFASELI